MNRSFNTLHLVNTYGAFGSVTRVRNEIVVEGTDEDVLTDDTVWREYAFRGKPGDVRRLPRQFAPYHLRLDWLMWFAALSPAYARTWFEPALRPPAPGRRPRHPRAAARQPLPARASRARTGTALPLPVHHMAGAARDG